MNTLKLLPAILSFLLLGAHFLRSDHLLIAVLCLLCVPFLFVRRQLLTRLFQGGLAVGAIVWMITLLQMVSMRRTLGEPWVRLALILGTVTVFTGFSAWLLQMRRREEK